MNEKRVKREQDAELIRDKSSLGWCHTIKAAPRLAGRIFPEWLYDANLWNDYLYVLDFKALETASLQARYLLGLLEARYGKDGYGTLNRKGAAYDLQKVLQNIYGQSEPKPPYPELVTPAVSELEQQRWTFPDVDALEQLIGRIPVKSRTAIVFVPYHHRYLGPPGGKKYLRIERCKNRITQMARRIGNVDVVDMMYRNEFTLNDSNYWDSIHYHDEAAIKVENAIAQYIKSGTTKRPIARVLVRARNRDEL